MYRLIKFFYILFGGGGGGGDGFKTYFYMKII